MNTVLRSFGSHSSSLDGLQPCELEAVQRRNVVLQHVHVRQHDVMLPCDARIAVPKLQVEQGFGLRRTGYGRN